MRLKAEPNDSGRKTQSSSLSHNMGPVCGVRHRWQDPGSRLYPPSLAKQGVTRELLQMERLRDMQVWEVPAPGVGGRSQ